MWCLAAQQTVTGFSATRITTGGKAFPSFGNGRVSTRTSIFTFGISDPIQLSIARRFTACVRNNFPRLRLRTYFTEKLWLSVRRLFTAHTSNRRHGLNEPSFHFVLIDPAT